MKPPISRKLRCAIYTRKSSEEGLEQEFNSLHAQRDACCAYIASQRSEGWVELAGHYDDGGISGATLERPALKRLLSDIEEDRVDVVVVYKIDRLSRALMDFAKLVEVFDRNNVTFVSVTQSFNTTTSMGRLTLNIPCSPDNPEFLGVNDAKIVCDLVAPLMPVRRHFVAQEGQHRDTEFLEGRVGFVVCDVSVHQAP